MAELSANYQDLINDIMRRTEEQRKLGESRGIGEAQRRGLVNPTGTSDIEMSLRRAQTEPVVQGGQSQIAQLLANIAGEQEARAYQTSEREAGQKYGTSEREAGQQFSREENEAIRKWQTGERLSTQDYQALESAKQRGWQTGEREGQQLFQGQMEGYIDPSQTTWGGGKGGGQNWTPYTSGLDKKTYWGAAGQAERQREHEYGMGEAAANWAKAGKKKKNFWESAAPYALEAGIDYGMGWLPTKKR